MMSKPVAAISNLTNLKNWQGIHPAWLEAGYGIASSTPTYYNWQTLLTDLPTGVMPRQSLDSLPAVDFNNPRTALSAQPAVQQPAQQPASAATGVLPQVPAGASGNGASAELNQLLNSTGTLASDVVAQSALLEHARKQVEQQKLLQQQQQQQQMQVNQLQQQNAILAQQVAALKQQVITPTNVTVPLASGGVASSNPYLVGLGTVGSYPNASSLIYPANQLYSPGFSTAGMGVTPSTPPPQTTTTPAPTTAPVSSTPTPTAVTGETPKTKERKPAPSGKRVISNPDGKLTLTEVGIGKYKLDSEAAEAFKKANKEVKDKTGKDIPLISAYRSPEHNKKIGGAPNSNHTRGGSLDLDKNAGNYRKSLEILEANGFKSLRGVIYNKPGSGPQDEENHLDFVGENA
jgi:hypothetical protein